MIRRIFDERVGEGEGGEACVGSGCRVSGKAGMAGK